MKVMGMNDLALVAPLRYPDPEADARATGAVDVLHAAALAERLDEALSGATFALALSARPRDLGPPCLGVREAVQELLGRAMRGETVALVFGNETVGLSNDELQRCQAVVTLSTNPDFSSLNLGAAVQVLCHELRMAALAGNEPPASGKVTPFTSPLATLDEVEGFYAHLETFMVAAGFHDPRRPKRLMPKLRRLFGRVALEKDEINILRGILAEAGKKMTHPGT